MEIFEWYKEKLRVITSGDLRKFREDARFPVIFTEKRLYDKTCRKREKRILEKVFGQIKPDMPFIYSLIRLYEFSPVFQNILIVALTKIIDRYNADVDSLLNLAPKLIVDLSRKQKAQLISSIQNENDLVKFAIDLPITGDGGAYRVRDEWSKFLSLL